MMKYQLVIQWPAFSLKDYDAIIEIENLLIGELSEKNEVDGHDVGANEVNIFIRTDNPENVFDEVKTILDANAFLVNVKAAYREVLKSEYTILWPKDLERFQVA